MFCIFPLFVRKPIVSSGQGLQMETSLLAKSGIFTEMFINVHCPCQINKYYQVMPSTHPNVLFKDSLTSTNRVCCGYHNPILCSGSIRSLDVPSTAPWGGPAPPPRLRSEPCCGTRCRPRICPSCRPVERKRELRPHAALQPHTTRAWY